MNQGHFTPFSLLSLLLLILACVAGSTGRMEAQTQGASVHGKVERIKVHGKAL
jgi:hypothetical protein